MGVRRIRFMYTMGTYVEFCGKKSTKHHSLVDSPFCQFDCLKTMKPNKNNNNCCKLKVKIVSLLIIVINNNDNKLMMV